MLIVLMVGLVIDVGILYSAKSRLQAAVDGASLAAARALNLGQTTNAQATHGQAERGELVLRQLSGRQLVHQ